MDHVNFRRNQKKPFSTWVKGQAFSSCYRGRSLIVDDDPVVRAVLADVLNGHRFSVKQAGSLNQAGRLLTGEAFDLIFLDLSFPNESGSGFDFLDVIRSRQSRSKVIIVTVSNDFNHAIRALRHQVFDYLTKPFLVEDIGRIVECAAGSSREDDGMMNQRSLGQSLIEGITELTERERRILESSIGDR